MTYALHSWRLVVLILGCHHVRHRSPLLPAVHLGQTFSKHRVVYVTVRGLRRHGHVVFGLGIVFAYGIDERTSILSAHRTTRSRTSSTLIYRRLVCVCSGG